MREMWCDPSSADGANGRGGPSVPKYHEQHCQTIPFTKLFTASFQKRPVVNWFDYGVPNGIEYFIYLFLGNPDRKILSATECELIIINYIFCDTNDT